MLLLNNQFILKHAVRSHLYLTNPPVSEQEGFTLPRYSVVHYLDLTSDVKFLDRTLNYLFPVPKNKKVPVMFIEDLTRKEGTTSLRNKYLPADIRKWRSQNTSSFIIKNLIEEPTKDVGVVSIINYNCIKDLYNYQTSLLMRYNVHRNIAETFWDNISLAVKNKDLIQIVPMDVPTILPNRHILNKILAFSPVKQMRIINDEKLRWMLELYTWLTNVLRDKSAVKLTDEEATRVMLEFKYRGYSSFVLLSTIRMISEESELKSSFKVNNDKLHKLFLMFLNGIQRNVDAILDGKDKEEEKPNDTTEEESFDDTHDDESKVDETSVQDTQKEELEKSQYKISGYTKSSLNKLTDMDEISLDPELEERNLLASIDEKEDTDAFVDSFFEKRLNQVAKEPTVLVEKEETEEVIPLKQYTPEEATKLLVTKKPEDVVNEYLETAISAKTHTSAEIRSIRKLLDTRKILKDPYNEKEFLNDALLTKPKDLVLTKDNTKITVSSSFVKDEFKTNVIGNFDKKYINGMLQKDILDCVANLEQGDVIIKDYTVEDVQTSTDRYETHKLTLKPVNGKESTVYFRIPKIDSEGRILVSGNMYTLRKTRTDHPLRKISPIRVAVTSNYGKMFIGRTERKTNDPDSYITNFIQQDYLNEGNVVKKLIPGKKILNKVKTPNIYNVLARSFSEIHTTDLTLLTNPKTVSNHITEEVSLAIEKKGYVFCGYTKNKEVVVVGYDNVFYNYSKDLEPIGTIEDILGIEPDKVPKPFSTVKVLGDDIPLGVVLSYHLGLSGLLAVTDTKYQVLPPRQQYKPTRNQLVLRFEDYKLVIDTDTIEKQLLFNGFLFFKDFTKRYPLSSFDDTAIYLNLIEFRGSGLIHLKELDSLRKRFIDPITRDVLQELNEPTEYLKVLMKANYMLSDYNHPDINDPNYSRIRGFDRVPGLMYRALCESLREYNLKGRTGSKVAIDPYKVWNYITQDSTVKTSEELNPILNLKESEAVTFTGLDGLNKERYS